MTILVVDDEPLIADALCVLLRGEGYDVRCAYGGGAALAEVERAPPELVVSDVMMPGIDGIALALRMRERGIPVLLMSAARRAAGIPGVGFIRKPFDLDDVLAAVAAALAGRSASRGLGWRGANNFRITSSRWSMSKGLSTTATPSRPGGA